MAITRVRVGDRSGRIIADIAPAVATVSWILDKPGRCNFTMARTDSKATADVLAVANRVYMEFDNGFPPWGGTIELPRSWGEGVIGITCYTLDYTFNFRITGKNRNYYYRSVGDIFSDLVTRAEAAQSLGVRIGNVWTGGGLHSPQYHYRDMYDIFTASLAKMEYCDFDFTPVVESGRILFEANFYERRGADKSTNIMLIEGPNANIANVTLEEQGPVYNRVTAIGSGSTWDDARQTATAMDSDSIEEIGLREKKEQYNSVLFDATLDRHAQTEIKLSSRGRKMVKLEVADALPARFADYDVGDIVKVVAPSLYFNGLSIPVRVTAREWDDVGRRCSLVVEEWRNVTPMLSGDTGDL